MTEHQVSTEFVFDRASGQALAHAYRVLVPERRARSAQRRDDDDRDQTSRTDRESATRLQLVTEHDEGQDRPALRA